jgi:hypothetical protein
MDPSLTTAYNPIRRLRVYHYYLPVFFWVSAQLRQHKQRHAASSGAPAPPLVVSLDS